MSVDGDAKTNDIRAIIDRFSTRVPLPDGHGGTSDAVMVPIVQRNSFPKIEYLE